MTKTTEPFDPNAVGDRVVAEAAAKREAARAERAPDKREFDELFSLVKELPEEVFPQKLGGKTSWLSLYLTDLGCTIQFESKSSNRIVGFVAESPAVDEAHKEIRRLGDVWAETHTEAFRAWSEGRSDATPWRAETLPRNPADALQLMTGIPDSPELQAREMCDAPPQVSEAETDAKAAWLADKTEEYLRWYTEQDKDTQDLEWELAKMSTTETTTSETTTTDAPNAVPMDAATTTLVSTAADASASGQNSDPKAEPAGDGPAPSADATPAATPPGASTTTDAKKLPAIVNEDGEPLLPLEEYLALLGEEDIHFKIEMGRTKDDQPMYLTRRFPAEGFVIDSPEKAQWFGNKVRTVQLEMEEIVACAGAMLRERKTALEGLWTVLGGQFRDYCEPRLDRYKQDTKDKDGNLKHRAGDLKGPKKLKFLGPTGAFAVFFRKTGGIRIRSEYQLKEWAKRLSPEEFAKWGFQMEPKRPTLAHLQALIDGGEPLPPGVELAPKQELGFMGIGAADKTSSWTAKSLRDRFTSAMTNVIKLRAEAEIEQDEPEDLAS